MLVTWASSPCWQILGRITVVCFELMCLLATFLRIHSLRWLQEIILMHWGAVGSSLYLLFFSCFGEQFWWKLVVLSGSEYCHHCGNQEGTHCPICATEHRHFSSTTVSAKLRHWAFSKNCKSIILKFCVSQEDEEENGQLKPLCFSIWEEGAWNCYCNTDLHAVLFCVTSKSFLELARIPHLFFMGNVPFC